MITRVVGGEREKMESLGIVIGTAIISVAASIITVRWLMNKEIKFLNQMYSDRLDYMLKRSEEIVLDVLKTNVHKP